jgi:predicted O-methyltransferase YrrM
MRHKEAPQGANCTPRRASLGRRCDHRIVDRREATVSEHDRNWKFAGDIVAENEVVARARAQSLELGIEPIAPAVGAQVAIVVAATAAKNIVEIGTGVGVSGLWLLRGGTDAVLTSIDSELDHQQHARALFTEARIPANRVRLITGKALDVLPRMNENSYDIVFVDADPDSVIEYVEHGLRLVRPGGTVLVAHALWKGRVSDPAQRDDIATGFRTLVTEIAASVAVVSALSPVGDGLLQITKLGE